VVSNGGCHGRALFAPEFDGTARLGRHRGTIHREINRNFYHTRFRDRFGNDYRGYYCMTANATAKRRRRFGRVKLLRHPALLAHVVAKLHAGWLPQQVVGRLKIDPLPVKRSEEPGKEGQFCKPSGTACPRLASYQPYSSWLFLVDNATWFFAISMS
jgi:hypothetical protein